MLKLKVFGFFELNPIIPSKKVAWERNKQDVTGGGGSSEAGMVLFDPE